MPSKNWNNKNLLCVVNVFPQYEWVKPLKDKKGKRVLNAFIKVVNESNQKPNKLWVNQGGQFYNKLIPDQLGDNDISMYSTFYEGKSVIAGKVIKSLKAEKVTSKSCLSYLNKLVD